MNYATGCAFNTDEIFETFKYEKLKMTNKEMFAMLSNRNKNRIPNRVFRKALQLILNDIIENNVTFELPTGSRKACIHVKRTTGEKFMKARQNGKWDDVDILKSMFSGNLLVLEMNHPNRAFRVKPIYVDNKLKDKLTKLTNEGKQYC